MYHRFNQLAGCLRSSQQLQALLPQGLKAVSGAEQSSSPSTRVSYTPTLTVANLDGMRGTVRDVEQLAPKSHDFPGDQFKIENVHGWKSWRDIPDSMIPTTSKRDPNNLIYGTRKYINLRKQQLWFQINDGRPVWLKLGLADQIWFYFLVFCTFITTIYVWYNFYLLWSGKNK